MLIELCSLGAIALMAVLTIYLTFLGYYKGASWCFTLCFLYMLENIARNEREAYYGMRRWIVIPIVILLWSYNIF